jgi:hypothetical protein
VKAFIDEHRDVHGVEPICRVMQVAPSTYWLHAARRAQPALRPARAQRDSKEAVELATLTWVSWFNHHRLLEPIGNIPPAEAEANYHRQLAESAVPA